MTKDEAIEFLKNNIKRLREESWSNFVNRKEPKKGRSFNTGKIEGLLTAISMIKGLD